MENVHLGVCKKGKSLLNIRQVLLGIENLRLVSDEVMFSYANLSNCILPKGLCNFFEGLTDTKHLSCMALTIHMLLADLPLSIKIPNNPLTGQLKSQPVRILLSSLLLDLML